MVLNFEQFLKEKGNVKGVSWVRSPWEAMTNNYLVPLTADWIDNALKGTKNVQETFVHACDARDIGKLASIQNSKKAISCLSRLGPKELDMFADRMVFSGETRDEKRLTALVVIWGERILDSQWDVNSAPDDQGRRWTSPADVFGDDVGKKTEGFLKAFEKFYMKVFKNEIIDELSEVEGKEFARHARPHALSEIKDAQGYMMDTIRGLDDYFARNKFKEAQKRFRYLTLKAYIDFWNGYLTKNAAAFKKNYEKTAKARPFLYRWAESIVVDFEIVAVILDSASKSAARVGKELKSKYDVIYVNFGDRTAVSKAVNAHLKN